MRQLLSFLLCFFIIGKIKAQDLGSKAPDIVFSQCLNSSIEAGYLKNKYIILDFWATWCGPCIASFPHLNELSKKFASDSVVFAIISSEETSKVAKFLKTRNIQALHLIDSITDQSKQRAKVNSLYGLTAQAFKVEGIPHCVVIDNQGIVRWIGSSKELKEEDLRNILNGKATTAEKKRKEEIEAYHKKKERQKAIFEQIKKDTLQGHNFFAVTARVPYKSWGMSAGVIPDRGIRYVEFSARSFDFFCMYFNQVSFQRIKNRLPLKDSSIFFRLEMDSATDKSTFNETALRLLERAYNIKFNEKQITAPVWAFSIKDHNKFLQATKPLDSLSNHSSSDENEKELIYSNYTLQEVANDLEDYLHTFIITDNNPAFYKLSDIIIPKGSKKVVQQYLLNVYGIEMKQTKRRIGIIEIIPTPNKQ